MDEIVGGWPACSRRGTRGLCVGHVVSQMGGQQNSGPGRRTGIE